MLQETLALESDGELSELELELVLGGEVVIGDEDEDEGLYVPLPHGPLVIGDHRAGLLLDKTAQWGQKFGKQYPANPSKRSSPAFLAEHDYHSADPAAAKRARFREEDQPPSLSIAPLPYTGMSKEPNQSKVFEELADVASRGQQNIVHVRISSEEL